MYRPLRSDGCRAGMAIVGWRAPTQFQYFSWSHHTHSIFTPLQRQNKTLGLQFSWAYPCSYVSPDSSLGCMCASFGSFPMISCPCLVCSYWKIGILEQPIPCFYLSCYIFCRIWYVQRWRCWLTFLILSCGSLQPSWFPCDRHCPKLPRCFSQPQRTDARGPRQQSIFLSGRPWAALWWEIVPFGRSFQNIFSTVCQDYEFMEISCLDISGS